LQVSTGAGKNYLKTGVSEFWALIGGEYQGAVLARVIVHDSRDADGKSLSNMHL
jgi:hypothetical protein